MRVVIITQEGEVLLVWVEELRRTDRPHESSKIRIDGIIESGSTIARENASIPKWQMLDELDSFPEDEKTAALALKDAGS